jgi:hypothetical protein
MTPVLRFGVGSRARWGIFLVGIGFLATGARADPGGFTLTGSMNTARSSHTATLLNNGQVLVTGGVDSTGADLASAELYDRATASWSNTGSLATSRRDHTATVLGDGLVLVAGGFNLADGELQSAEVYDPGIGTWTETAPMTVGRSSHTATYLPSLGWVLVAGGSDSTGVTATAEIYEELSGGFWFGTNDMLQARTGHTATLLQDGTVLVVGGSNPFSGTLNTAEIYLPGQGSWISVASMTTPREKHTATLLANGMVLVAGGMNGNGFVATAEVFDPVNREWLSGGSLTTARSSHTATLLPNGAVLVAGGNNAADSLASAELFNPLKADWSITGSLNEDRFDHASVLLMDGTPLVTGGQGTNGTLPSAELFDASPPVIISPLTATATVDLAFSYQFETKGATSLAVNSTLPDGLTFDPALRAIIGTPTMAGSFAIDLSASNQFGTTDATLVLTIQPLPTSGPIIISVTSATGRTNSFFRFQIITSGGSEATELSATGLPADLSIDSATGGIFGTVAADGSYLVTLSATDAGITNTATLELTFSSDPALPVITSAVRAALFPGLDFSYQIDAPNSDTSDPITYSRVGPLPAGLGLDQDAGLISGIFSPPIGLGPGPDLAGGVVTNTQIYACNSSGCAAQGLYFFLPSGAADISTRLSVGTGNDVLIAGFITAGNASMKILARGIGPSLGLDATLTDPFLELFSGGSSLTSNDNWKENEFAIENTGIPPIDDNESAILAGLQPGAYTAILSGKNNGTGIGLVEVYNLEAASSDVSANAYLANISTRGRVQTGNNVMIGGFINQGPRTIQVLIRAIGPSLGISGSLANPVLQVFDEHGTLIETNDDWETSSKKTEIIATTIAPSNSKESAVLLTLPVGPTAYTAIVLGANNTTGVALVEAYFGNPFTDGCLGSSCP